MNLIELINNLDPVENLKIGFLGQSGYVLKKDTTTLLIDPYLSNYVEHPDGGNNSKMKRKFPPVVRPEEINNMDAVLCTHTHVDHMDPWTLGEIDQPFKLYCSKSAYNQNPINIDDDQLLFMDWEQTYTINEFQVVPIPAAHYHQADQGGNPDCLSLLISVGGLTLFFWGDGIPYNGLIDRLSSVQFHFFFAPINGRDWFREEKGIVGNLDSRELVQICRKLNIDTVIPNHFDMFEYNGEYPEHFINYLNQFAPNQEYKILKKGEIITV